MKPLIRDALDIYLTHGDTERKPRFRIQRTESPRNNYKSLQPIKLKRTSNISCNQHLSSVILILVDNVNTTVSFTFSLYNYQHLFIYVYMGLIKLSIASLIIHSFYILPLVYLILFDFSWRDNSPPYLVLNWSTSIYVLFLKQNLLHVFTVSLELKMRNMSYMCNRKKHVAFITGGIKKSPSPCTA